MTSTTPAASDIGFATDLPVSATFSRAMQASAINNTTFKLQSDLPDGGRADVAGAVAASGSSASFTPAAPLAPSAAYTATLTTGITDANGVPLASDVTFTFQTHSRPVAVNLGAAGNEVILAETKISTVPASAITGDVAISPAAETFITGFSLTADATNVFSTSPQVTGKVFAASDASPTPSALTTAVNDMGTAFVDAAGRSADVSELGAGDIGGLTLSPGVYKWGTGLLIPTDLHLLGSATDVWIFEVAQDLALDNGVNVFLAGGALPKNIFWQVSGKVDLGTTSHFEGVILSQTAITLATGASINGRLLAQSAVVLDTNTVVQPAP